MSKFSERKAAALSERDERNRLHRDHDNNQQRIKAERGPELWDKLKSELVNICAEVNTDYKGGEVLHVVRNKANSVVIEFRHAGKMQNLEVDFLPSAGVVKWHVGGPHRAEGEYPMRVHQDDDTVDFAPHAGERGGPRYIAEQMIDAVTLE